MRRRSFQVRMIKVEVRNTMGLIDGRRERHLNSNVGLEDEVKELQFTCKNYFTEKQLKSPNYHDVSSLNLKA